MHVLHLLLFDSVFDQQHKKALDKLEGQLVQG